MKRFGQTRQGVKEKFLNTWLTWLMPFHVCAEHRPLTTPLHLTPFCVMWASMYQLCPAFDISSSTDLRQVFLGLPRLLFPWRFHFMVCRVMLLGSFLSVCPIQVHFCLWICRSGGSWLVCCQSFWLLVQFGHQILRILRRHLPMMDCTRLYDETFVAMSLHRKRWLLSRRCWMF